MMPGLPQSGWRRWLLAVALAAVAVMAVLLLTASDPSENNTPECRTTGAEPQENQERTTELREACERP